MARRTVKVSVPINNPDKFSKLLNDIQTHHELLGPASPLNNVPGMTMADFKNLLTNADDRRTQAAGLREQSENANEQAEAVYGRDAGQTVETPGTLYNMEDRIKNHLLNLNKGNEEALSEFGFSVQVGTAKSPKRKTNP